MRSQLCRLVILPMAPQTLLRTGATRVLCPPNSLFLGLKHPSPSLVVLPLPLTTVLRCLPPRLLERNIILPRQPPHTASVLSPSVLTLVRYPPSIRPSRLPVCLQVGTPPRTHLTLMSVNPRVAVASVTVMRVTTIVNSPTLPLRPEPPLEDEAESIVVSSVEYSAEVTGLADIY